MSNLQSWSRNNVLCSSVFYSGKSYKSLIGKKGILATRSLSINDRFDMYKNVKTPLTILLRDKYAWPAFLTMTETHCNSTNCGVYTDPYQPYAFTFNLGRGPAQDFWYPGKQNDPNFAWMHIQYFDRE
ncbi:hypothetical protein ACSYON_004535, partial [Vibrio vulnificus]